MEAVTQVVFSVDDTINKPLAYTRGRILANSQLVDSHDFRQFSLEVKGDRQKMADGMVILYMVYSPESQYRHMALGERFKLLKREDHIADHTFADGFLSMGSVPALIKLYEDMTLTPAIRLGRALLESTHRFIREITMLEIDDAESAKKALEQTETGEALYKRLKSIEKLIDDEKVVTVRKGYTPALFEDPEKALQRQDL